MQVSTAVRAACLSDIRTRGAAGVLHFRSGPPPSSNADPASGSLLATVTLSSPAFSVPTSTEPPTMVASGVPINVVASGTGTIGHWRLHESDGTTVVAQGVCNLTGGGNMEVSNLSATAGDPVILTGWTITLPE